MSERTRVDYYGKTLIDIAPAKADIKTALEEKGVSVPENFLLDDVAALIQLVSHNLLKQDVDGTEHWVSQTEIAAGYLEQRFNE